MITSAKFQNDLTSEIDVTCEQNFVTLGFKISSQMLSYSAAPLDIIDIWRKLVNKTRECKMTINLVFVVVQLSNFHIVYVKLKCSLLLGNYNPLAFNISELENYEKDIFICIWCFLNKLKTTTLNKYQSILCTNLKSNLILLQRHKYQPIFFSYYLYQTCPQPPCGHLLCITSLWLTKQCVAMRQW